KSDLKKSECHIHAKLQVRLKAIYRLRFEHTTVMLCRVLHVNRSTYYNFINKRPSKREVENQRLRKLLLEIYMKAKKRIGTRAFKIILLRDYGVNISEGRILRLLKSMTLPKMSTIKPRFKSKKAPVFSSDNLLKQEIYYGHVFNSFEELEQAITKWIHYYNTKRIKKKLNWMSPIQYRLTYSK
ncbi:IS3 family transposase, partial [Lactococcus lactis]